MRIPSGRFSNVISGDRNDTVGCSWDEKRELFDSETIVAMTLHEYDTACEKED